MWIFTLLLALVGDGGGGGDSTVMEREVERETGTVLEICGGGPRWWRERTAMEIEATTVVGIAGEAAVALVEVVVVITADGDDGHSLPSPNHRLLQWPSTTH